MTWVLAVDFGTTNTVAAVADEAGVHIVNVDGRPVLPSAVFLNEAGKSGKYSWIVGTAAVNFARRRLDRFEATPKKSVSDGTLFLAGQDVPVVEAIAAVFRVVTQEVAQQHGGQPPAAFTVTHPATWGESRVRVLLEAARSAIAQLKGWPMPHPLTEPEAAAQRTLGIETLPPECRLVVLDLGGGTVDVTVVDRRGPMLTVAGRPTGLDSLGGEDFDLRLARWMTAEVGRPGLFDQLATSEDASRRESAVEIRDHARDVKEQLSKLPAVPAQLPRVPPELPDYTPVLVSKPNLEELVRGGRGREPGLTEAVELVAGALAEAAPGPPPAGVFLVGGSSRIPLLGTLVTQRIGQPPLVHGDPTTAVADGAARHAWARAHGPAAFRPPGPAPVAVPPPRKRRRALAASFSAVTLAALVVAAYLIVVSNESSSSSYTCSDGTTVEYSFECRSPTTSATPTTPDTSDTSATSTATDTTTTRPSTVDDAGIVEASKRVWRMTSDLGSCTVDASNLMSGEKYEMNCPSGDVLYRVVWTTDSGRSEQSIVGTYRTATGADRKNFTLTDAPATVIGSKVQGAWTDSQGRDHYSCVWQYDRYPVALIITGQSASAVAPACDSATFYDNAQLADRVG
ncbi:Hsp70 family protein [Amycolatopsis sp. NPDC049252]|uniref:Hsp70 family protein n=1 Tax=Amycolatopsis sp. NPDC049252 TaxID=3363933 RepID=UPI0037141CEB